MPVSLPSVDECLTKLALSAPDDLSQAISDEMQDLLDDVIAEFQSPPGPKNTGGTGREFTPVTETRAFDGNGHTELMVDDIVPGSTITVNIYGAPLAAVALRQAKPGRPHNILYRTQWYGGALDIQALQGLSSDPDGRGSLPYPERIFPLGLQNINVNTTWGAVVTADIREAIRCEVCYRSLVTGFVGLNGVGSEIAIGDFSLNTSVGAINFKLTSPLTVFHDKWLRALATHRRKRINRFDRLKPEQI